MTLGSVCAIRCNMRKMEKMTMLTTGAGHMDIIKKLELYRLENKITQQDLAKELGGCLFDCQPMV